MAAYDDPTLLLLRDIRAEMNQRFDEIAARLDRGDEHLRVTRTDETKAPKGLIGHRAMVERSIASLELDMSELLRRVDALEARS